MTFRISQFAVAFGLSVMTMSGVAQAPRYQSPLNIPTAPQPQLTLPTPAPITPNGKVVEDVVVRVNDQIISRSDVERAEQELARELQQSNATPAEAEQRQKDLLRDMIDQQLLLSKGKELGLNADAEVIRRLDMIRKQNHLDSMEALEKAVAAQSISFEDFKANIRNSIITQQVVRDEVGRRIQMTQGQEQSYYDAHKQDFAQPEQVRLSEILIPTPPDATDATVAQAKTKAEDVEAKIKAGSKFEDLAKTYSGGSTAAQGGDLGTYKRGALAKVLEDQTFDLQPGQATAPIRTRQGFVILKVTEHQAAGTPPLKDIEPQIQEAIYMQQLQPALRAYLTKQREDAYIDIAPGFVDSGASANETKPVFTAYAPPPVKKKKVQQKQRFESNGGRFAAAHKVPAAAPVATRVAAVETANKGKEEKKSKPKKIKREKIRFGQAPRTALPAGPQETAVGGDVGEGSASATAIPGGATTAPGAAMTSFAEESSSQDAEANPLTPAAPEAKKTRFASREKIVLAEKRAAKARKAKEKAAAIPAPISAEEKAAEQTQSAPLGLNGDTVKKKKKVKVKGAKKERLENRPKPSTAPPPPPAPTVNPSLGSSPLVPTPPPPATPATPPQN